MSSGSAGPSRLRVRWLPSAQQSFLRSIARIGAQDARTARLVVQRVERALALLAMQPELGTPTERPDKRRFPIPNTGHTIDYHLTQTEIRVTRWARQRRKA